MSEFGDGTPSQSMMNWVKAVQEQHSLSNTQVVAILARVLSYLTEDWLNQR